MFFESKGRGEGCSSSMIDALGSGVGEAGE